MVVLGCGEKIDSEDGQRIGFRFRERWEIKTDGGSALWRENWQWRWAKKRVWERRSFFFFFGVLGFYVLLGFSEKK